MPQRVKVENVVASNDNSRALKGTVESINSKGEGIVSLSDSPGISYRIPNTLEGEKVLFEATTIYQTPLYKSVSSRTKAVDANLIRVLEPSADRIAPVCPVSFTCGGCQLQHQSYEAQLLFKRNLVVEAFQQYDYTKSLSINQVTPSLLLKNYRNKAQFAFQRDSKSSRIHLGLYRKSSHEVVDTAYCDIQHSLVNAIVEQIRFFCLQEPSLSIYDERTLTGSLRHLVVRVGFETEEALVCLVSATPSITQMPQLVEFLVNGPVGTKIKGILFHHNSETGDAMLTSRDSDTTVLHGQPYIHDSIAGVRVKVSLRSFTQSNPVQARVLYQTALDLMNCTGGETVYDLYCGVGTIGLYVAANAKVARVIGVEDVSAAVDDAIGNAKLNTLSSQSSQISFVCAKAEDWLCTHEKEPNEAIIVNPPRKGCHPALLAQLKQRGAQKIVYISCNPVTLARDINILAGSIKEASTDGVAMNIYRVACVQPVDMFPQTVHVETVVLLEKIL